MIKISNLKIKILNQIKNLKFKIENSLQSRGGFTMIELLVVIAIIATFLTAGLTTFSTAQKKGRDSRRKSDLKEIQSSLEQYYTVCGFSYPQPDGSGFFTSIVCTTPPVAIMPTVPQDPRGTTPYYCGPTPNASNCTDTQYTICTMLEADQASDTFCVNNAQ